MGSDWCSIGLLVGCYESFMNGRHGSCVVISINIILHLYATYLPSSITRLLSSLYESTGRKPSKLSLILKQEANKSLLLSGLFLLVIFVGGQQA